MGEASPSVASWLISARGLELLLDGPIDYYEHDSVPFSNQFL
jgi:hypothetical protein